MLDDIENKIILILCLLLIIMSVLVYDLYLDIQEPMFHNINDKNQETFCNI